MAVWSRWPTGARSSRACPGSRLGHRRDQTLPARPTVSPTVRPCARGNDSPCQWPERQGSSLVGASPTAPSTLSDYDVADGVVVSPSSAGWTSTATTTPVSRSTACSGLKARCIVPSFILAILASGSVGSSGRRSTASCLCACGRSTPNLRLSASRRRSLGHPRQHGAIALAIVAPRDRARGEHGLHGRPSTPSRSPLTRPRSATSVRARPNTCSCASCGRRERVRDDQE